LLQKFGSDRDHGLTAKKAHDLFLTLGPNTLTEKVGTPWYILLLKEFTGFFALLLWAGGILCLIGYGLAPDDVSNLALGLVLFFVVIVTGLFSYL
jgi:sodium/potassium-transporting ATPase subunit alpha